VLTSLLTRSRIFISVRPARQFFLFRVALLLATLSWTLLLLTSLLVLLVALVPLAALVWIAHVISFGQSSTPLGNALAR
jgi:hypothetical protein